MEIEEFWNNYTSSERELFQKSCRRLLKQTFIVRDKDEESKRAYFFVSKNLEPFSAYLGYIGFDVTADRENGVVMLRNCRDMGESGKLQINHVTLKKLESVVLCCLWILYTDRVRAGSLSKNIVISMTDLRFELEKYKIKDQVDKSTMTGILSLLSRYQLLQVIGKVGDEDCRICMYPSMQFALDAEEFQKFVEDAQRRMRPESEADSRGWREESDAASWDEDNQEEPGDASWDGNNQEEPGDASWDGDMQGVSGDASWDEDNQEEPGDAAWDGDIHGASGDTAWNGGKQEESAGTAWEAEGEEEV